MHDSRLTHVDFPNCFHDFNTPGDICPFTIVWMPFTQNTITDKQLGRAGAAAHGQRLGRR